MWIPKCYQAILSFLWCMALTSVLSGFFWPHSIPGNPGAPGNPDGPYGPGIIQGKVIPVNGNMWAGGEPPEFPLACAFTPIPSNGTAKLFFPPRSWEPMQKNRSIRSSRELLLVQFLTDTNAPSVQVRTSHSNKVSCCVGRAANGSCLFTLPSDGAPPWDACLVLVIIMSTSLDWSVWSQHLSSSDDCSFLGMRLFPNHWVLLTRVVWDLLKPIDCPWSDGPICLYQVNTEGHSLGHGRQWPFPQLLIWNCQLCYSGRRGSQFHYARHWNWPAEPFPWQILPCSLRVQIKSL